VALLCRLCHGHWYIWRDIDGPSPDSLWMCELLDGA
jgi:hypothetical protein